MDDAFGDTVATLAEHGLLVDENDQIKLTHQGLMLANDVATRFLP